MGRRARGLVQVAGLVALSAQLACTGSGPPPRPVPVVVDEPHLVDPLAGYPLTIEEDVAERLRGLYRALRSGDDPPPIDDALEVLLGRDPGLLPAIVLRAEILLLEERPREAQALLEPVVAELPNYLAARLLLGRVAELADDVLVAYDAYRAVVADSPLAAAGAERLRPRALEIVHNRFLAAADQGRTEAAAEAFERLDAWAPEEPRTAEARWRIARLRNDDAAERAALEQLLPFAPDRREVLERLVELDLEAGQYRAGIERLEELRRRFPDEDWLRDDLERAKFLWRLNNLPRDIREMARRPELTRAEFATLLFWLVPEVRISRISDPPIASDIIDHPRRDEIVRVLALRLLAVDERMRRFAPERPIGRAAVLGAFLGLLGRSSPGLECLAGTTPAELQRSPGLTCRLAARCELLAEEGDCLPAAPVSGAEALDLLRALDRLGVL